MADSRKTDAISLFAPAKVNLYLHVTGKRRDGYHTLDSLAVFADVGDRIEIAPAPSFSFHINGPFSSAFLEKERDAGPDSGNIVPRAVWALAEKAGREPHCRITLTKNLPLASGLGGGSADAAAAVWGLMELWDIPRPSPAGDNAPPWLADILSALGSDVPACLRCAPVFMKGAGEILRPAPPLPEIPVLLVHPGKFCPTPDVFAAFEGPFSNPLELPGSWDGLNSLYGFLERQRNDLTEAAAGLVPEVREALDLLAAQDGCRIARMSGSGASCFGLFADELQVMDAAEGVLAARPDWWARSGTLNRPQRY